MFKKSFVLAILAASALSLSGAAYADSYAGGPKAMFPVRVYKEPVQTKKPYAQTVPGERPVTKHIYLGGPKSSTPHTQR